MKWLLAFLIALPAQADWMVKARSPICTTKGALDIYEMHNKGIDITSPEETTLRNECDFRPYPVKVLPQWYGTYAQVQALNHKGKRKVYFVDMDDLERVE